MSPQIECPPGYGRVGETRAGLVVLSWHLADSGPVGAVVSATTLGRLGDKCPLSFKHAAGVARFARLAGRVGHMDGSAAPARQRVRRM